MAGYRQKKYLERNVPERKKRSGGILYLIRIASQKACFSRKKPFLFSGITVNQIDAPFSVDASIDLNFVLNDVLLVTSCSFASFSFFFRFLMSLFIFAVDLRLS